MKLIMRTQQIYSVLESYSDRERAKEENSSMNKGGLQRLCESFGKEITIVGSRPYMGSTSLMISMALEMAKAGKRILFYGHPHHKIADKISRYVGRKEGCSCPFLKDVPLYFAYLLHEDDFHTIKSKLREEVRDIDPYCIFIDSLQDIVIDDRLISAGMTPEEFMCRELRDLAYMLDTRIVVAAGLNLNTEERCGIEGKLPQLGDFRGGDLAYYASKIIFPYRPEYYHIYHDERTGEDIRGYMYIYGSNLGDCEGLKLRFDHHTARVYDPEHESWVSGDESESANLPF